MADRLDRFADALAEHVDADDIAAGRGAALDPGGSVPETSRRLGIYPGDGNSMLQQIRKRLGPQAR